MFAKIIDKILVALAAIGTGLSAIFYVLMKQAKEERKSQEKENKSLKANLEALAAADEAVREDRKANEELIETVDSSNKLDAFDACNELLQK